MVTYIHTLHTKDNLYNTEKNNYCQYNILVPNILYILKICIFVPKIFIFVSKICISVLRAQVLSLMTYSYLQGFSQRSFGGVKVKSFDENVFIWIPIK